MEQIRGILGLVHFLTSRSLAHRFPCEFIGLQVEGKGIFICHSGQNNAHHVRDGEPHFIKNGSRLLFHIRADSGTNNSI